MVLSRQETLVVYVMRVLAFAFAVTGLLFLLRPDPLLGAIAALGEKVGDFAPSPPTGSKLWLGLAFSYMVLVTGLAYLVQRDVRTHRHLLLLLALGKLSSSFTALYFFLLEARVFIYLVNFFVDGGIVVMALGCYLWTNPTALRAPVNANASHSSGV